MSKKVEKDRSGMIIHEEDALEKMEVELTEVKAPGDDKSPVLIYYNWCKKCGICVTFCPTGCLGRKADGSPMWKLRRSVFIAKPVTACVRILRLPVPRLDRSKNAS